MTWHVFIVQITTLCCGEEKSQATKRFLFCGPVDVSLAASVCVCLEIWREAQSDANRSC